MSSPSRGPAAHPFSASVSTLVESSLDVADSPVGGSPARSSAAVAMIQAHSQTSVGVWVNKLSHHASLSFDSSNGYWIAGTYLGVHVVEAGHVKTPSLVGRINDVEMLCLCSFSWSVFPC
jgi:hypothetical protein